ncbi:MAG: sugar ABC transporter permease [Alphaproteobacteria bacterium]|nr:sugar ABC transporter permease [Alphaproteobacteria bacterium]
MPRRLLDFVHDSFKYWSLLPAVVLLLLITVYPSLHLLQMSVSTIEFVGGRDVWSFTPGRNLELLLSDAVLQPAIVNTIVFVVLTVVIELTLGLALALLVARLPRGKSAARTAMILPILVPAVAIGCMWKLMYNYDFGLFNQALGGLGLEPVNWLGSTNLALMSVIIVDVWHWTPFVFLILFAAAEGLPVDVIEASQVDGATSWQITWRIVIPMLRNALAVAFVFRSIFAFKVFDEIYLLTSGGPGTSTEVVNLHLYKVFFEQNQLGYGALLSVAFIATILAYLAVSRRMTQGAAR